MDPMLYRTFAEAFVAEWHHSQGDVAAERAANEAELQRVRYQIKRLVDAIVNGTPAPRSTSACSAAAAHELIHGLIEHITLHPEADGYRVEVCGELAAILALAGGGVSANSATGTLSGGTHDKGPSVSAGASRLALQMKLVAGTGFEPVTFRL